MLKTVELRAQALTNYAAVIGDEVIEQIRTLAKPLVGARVLHISATAFGGGVAEMLYTLVPLMRDVGLNAEWRIITGSDDFFTVTKSFHNGLQGMDLPLTETMKDIWRKYNEYNAAAFEGEYDFVIVHDPQPAGMRVYCEGKGGRRWIWRCHIDTSTPNPAFWEFIVPYLQVYDAGIFTMQQYVGQGLTFPHLAIVTPTIDPLSPKNAEQSSDESRKIVHSYGIDLNRPLLTQVSRYDPWKDPLGVIDAYRLVKREVPGVQLALLGSMASDDPEGWTYYDRTVRHAGEDFDIYILHNFHGVSNREVNAFQKESNVVIQKSTREGFGLVVTEALWKGTPVVGGNVGGIPLQVLDGETGFLVDSIETCAEKTLHLLRHPDEAKRMGREGREHVRNNFLSTRHLRDYLQLFTSLD
ncbi:MAG: glycosyltransferase [Chloroflexota bacterium]|nr:glycosyltransferase [Chloroflexota bacterium]